MLAAVSPLHGHGHGHGEEEEEEKTTDQGGEVIVPVLLDDINFDDIFVGLDDGGGCDDILIPDLEIDPPDDIFADFSFNSSASGEGEEEEEESTVVAGDGSIVALVPADGDQLKESQDDRADEYLSQNHHEVVVSGRSHKVQEEEEEDEYGCSVLVSAAAAESAVVVERPAGENRSGRKLSTTKGSHAKKKVDWTPELHRRFVQAVEQLGVDKAVPSRILQLMGIDCLTRHNIASHLQKYRSHRKHLLAKEAEAASWSQRRQMYAVAGGGGGVMMKRAAVDMKKPASWQAPPIVGFPPPQMRPLIRPLHVWGHPSAADRPQLVPVWPRAHLTPPPPPQPWLPPVGVGPPPPMPDPSYWHPAHYQMALTQGMPFFPPQLVPAMRFQAPPVPSIHPHPLFRPAPSSHDAAAAAATTVNPTPSSCNHSAVFDAHPSNEKIDAVIGDVLAKPWSALPLGLKPPSLESVMVELQRQGVAKVPPPTSTSGA